MVEQYQEQFHCLGILQLTDPRKKSGFAHFKQISNILAVPKVHL